MEISMRIFSDRRAKRVEQNGLKVARTSEMVGSFKVVLFCPEHLSIIKEGWFKTNPLYVIYFTPLKASYALNITVACALVAVPLGLRMGAPFSVPMPEISSVVAIQVIPSFAQS